MYTYTYPPALAPTHPRGLPRPQVVNNTLAGEVYVLTQCGAPAPALTSLPPGARVFSIPLTSVAVPETVPYAFLELLGVADRVQSVSPFVVSPCGQFLVAECDRAVSDDFSQESSNATWLADTFLPTTDAVAFSGTLDLPTAFSFSAATDPGALARAEWIKFLGVFFNLDAYANKVYDRIAALYWEVAASAKDALEADGGDAPVVAFTQHFSYPGFASSYQISFAPYKLDLIEGASARSLNATEVLEIPGAELAAFSTSDIAFTYGAEGATFDTQEEALEAFLSAVSDVDVLIDETFAADPTTYYLDAFLEAYALTNRTEEFEATQPWLANLTIFREDGLLSETLGLDWFEGALVRADEVLRDTVRAALGPEAAGTDSFTWIRSIHETPVVVGPSDCAATKGKVGAAACSAAPATICPYVAFCDSGAAVLLNATGTSYPTNSAGDTCAYAACA